MESPLPGDRHGGFGERPGETDREQPRHRAPGRLNHAPGSGLTPMLTNLRLLPADEHLGDLPIVRVTDNYAVFASDRQEAETAFVRVTDALAVAGLHPNPRKSKVWQPNLEDLFLAG